ncbi:MAG: nitrilase-related carbon-nitrogen hydrolase [Anaerolineae bacterium]
MNNLTVACVQQRLSIQSSREEFESEARRFLRQAQAKAARIAIFPELAGVMLAPPLISSLKLGFLKREDQSKQPGTGLLSRTWGRVAGTTAGALGGGFRGSLERLIQKKSDAFRDLYLDTFAQLAREYGIIIVGGSIYLYDEETGELRNRAYVFDVDGSVLGYQDKLNVAPTEQGLATPGADLRVINTRHARLGLLIGRDALYPELSRLLAVQNAELLVGLAASPGVAQAGVVRSAVALRAEENQVFAAVSFLLGANYLSRGTEEEFFGQSAVLAPISLSPKGDGVLVQAGTNRTETLIAADVDQSALQQLHETSRFRPRSEMHLANLGPVLGEMYAAGLTIEEAIAQDLAGVGQVEVEEPEPLFGEPALEVEAPTTEEPEPERPEAPELAVPESPPPEPPTEVAVDIPSVPEALSITGQRQPEEEIEEGEQAGDGSEDEEAQQGA